MVWGQNACICKAHQVPFAIATRVTLCSAKLSIGIRESCTVFEEARRPPSRLVRPPVVLRRFSEEVLETS
jgi:hypothetical protein